MHPRCHSVDIQLKVNDDKTEAIILSSHRMSTSLPMPDSLTVGTSNVMFSQSVKTLGLMLDTLLTMKTQVIDLVRIANFELRRISSISSISFCRRYTEARSSLCHVHN